MIDVVGIGADGWSGLADASKRAVASAEVLFGSARQLDSVPPTEFAGRRVQWPSPLMPALTRLLADHENSPRCVLASGDPMFFGIGTTLVRMLGAENIRVLPHPSSASLACARLGWAVNDVEVVSLVARQPSSLIPALTHGRRVLVLSEDEQSISRVTQLLCDNGFGQSSVTVLAQLGGPDETVVTATAESWTGEAPDPLNVIAVDVVGARTSRVPGLPDECYSGDGQLTKNEIRALTLAALAPAAGETLWDVGGGSGSISIEWMRTHPSCRADIFEQSSERSKFISANAAALGVPSLRIHGRAPESFGDLASPDAVFVGGGVTEPGLLDACWDRLAEGGRMVVNAVTAESESLILQWYSRKGGVMKKFQVYRADALGSFTAWRPQLPVAQWVATK
ncbi:precorrin-6Y-methylase [Rhodococcoides trifolii]|uniref:Precorrin-6Y-methylase n=1 Tax=Rhodococcoides trifolii TaxID=908250 RepID=A0A917D5B2_9NOCA|nr:precorrin-6y C5,15-methyltransferase (decarboxylating) subunit CbiE [Rhodococcus trifolii]GGG10255.1 precorrin-6Y-methylase [Rhodococcus trifolii]